MVRVYVPTTGASPGRNSNVEINSHRLSRSCRTGVQALFGFQLIAVFSTAFKEDLLPAERKLHLAAISLSRFDRSRDGASGPAPPIRTDVGLEPVHLDFVTTSVGELDSTRSGYLPRRLRHHASYSVRPQEQPLSPQVCSLFSSCSAESYRSSHGGCNRLPRRVSLGIQVSVTQVRAKLPTPACSTWPSSLWQT
jgi:hypothetical protein